jgi:transposase
MIRFDDAVRVWAYPAPCDMRKGFNGLSHLVTWQLEKELTSGDCFLFLNRRKNTAKVLTFDGSGLCIFHKRLERGCFPSLWNGKAGEPISLTAADLAMFLTKDEALFTKLSSKTPKTLASKPLF